MTEYVCRMVDAALKDDAFTALLCGQHPYTIPDREGSYQTDRGSILYCGIYRYFETDNTIKAVFESTLCKLIQGSSFELLTAFEYIWRCKSCEARATAPFSLSPQCVTALKRAVTDRRAELERYRDLPEFGASLPSGAWDYIHNIHHLLQQQHGAGLWA